jgi:hypothetical protein
MFKNVASQTLSVFAFDATTNLPKTGDAANITAYVKIDGGSVTVLADTSAAEDDATNAKGFYTFSLAQAETNGDKLQFSAKSNTSNIVVIAVPAVVQTQPVDYIAEIECNPFDDTHDVYVATWFKRGAIVTSGVTSPLIRVVEVGTAGTEIIASTAMTEVGSEEKFCYFEPSDRLENNQTVIVECKATIDGSVRTWSREVFKPIVE